MASTYQLITSTTLGASATSVTLSSIPSTYTDLVVRISARSDRTTVNNGIRLIFNSSSAASYSYTNLVGTGTTASSGSTSAQTLALIGATTGTSATANTFSNHEIYIPSYTVAQNKPYSSFAVTENNATAAEVAAYAELWSNTSAINSITFTPAGTSINFITGSSFYLYGVKNS
jgi:hypothetical protein